LSFGSLFKYFVFLCFTG